MQCQGHARRCFHLSCYFQCSLLLISYTAFQLHAFTEHLNMFITALLGYPYGLFLSRTDVFLDLLDT
jgi:ABC-type Fe3+-siderophore transport system permease subunit